MGTRIVDFSDGFTSDNAPSGLTASADSFASFVDDAAFIADKGAAATEDDAYYNTTLKLVRVYNGTAWVSQVDESTAQGLTNKTIDADNNTISNLAHGAEVDNPTAAHGVGEIVGTSEVQTLSNKTIDATNNTISNLQHGTHVDEPTAAHGVGEIVGTSESQVLSNKSFSDDVLISGTTQSTSKDTGSLVTEGGLGVEKNAYIGGELHVTGSMSVGGTLTYVNSTNLEVADHNFVVNKGGDDASSIGAGMTVERTSTNGSMIFDPSTFIASRWGCGLAGSESEIVTIVGAQTLSNKYLTHALIQDDLFFTEVGVDPSTPSAGSRKLYAKSDGFYQVDSSGTVSKIGEGGGLGSDSIYGFLNEETDDTGDWTTDGTATVTENTTTPLSGDADYKITVTGTTQWVRTPAQTLARRSSEAHQTHQIRGVFNITGTDGAKFTLRALDQANNRIGGDVIIVKSNEESEPFEVLANVTSSVTSVKLEVESTSFTAGDILFLDDIVFDDDAIQVKDVYASTEWEEYTPTLSAGFGATSSEKFWWRRVGDSMEIRGNFTAGTTSGTTATVSLPSGYTIDFSKMKTGVYEAMGFWSRSANGAASTTAHGGIILTNSTYSDTVRFSGFMYSSSIDAYTPVGGSTIASSGDVITIKTSVPIAGWVDKQNHVARQEERQQAHEVASVNLSGNDGRAITANTEDVHFSGSGTGWTSSGDNNYYTVQEDNTIVAITGSMSASVAVDRDALLYKNGTLYRYLKDFRSTKYSGIQVFSYTSVVGEFAKGDTIHIRVGTGITLDNNVTAHYMTIVEKYLPPAEEKTVISTVLLPQALEDRYVGLIEGNGAATGSVSFSKVNADWISSVSYDGGTGLYTVVYSKTFASEPLPDGQSLSGNVAYVEMVSYSTTGCTFKVWNHDGTLDTADVKLTIDTQGASYSGKTTHVGSVPRNQVMYVNVDATNYQSGLARSAVYKAHNLDSLSGDIYGSVASDQLTLPAGRFALEIPLSATNGANWLDFKLYNATDTSTYDEHLNVVYGATGAYPWNIIHMEVNISAPKAFEFQTLTDGSGGDEYIGRIKITKLND